MPLFIPPVTPAPSGVTSVSGSADQIVVTGTTTPVLSLPSPLYAPGNIFANGIFSQTGNIGSIGVANPAIYITGTDTQSWLLSYNSGGDIFGVYDASDDAWAVYFANGTQAATFTSSVTVTGALSASNLSGSNTGDQTINSLLPSQTGNSGKVLQTNGSATSWGTVSGGSATGGYEQTFLLMGA